MTSPRLVIHLARRLLARSRGRSVLITAMIALPVIGMTALGTVFASMQPSPAQSLSYELGNTQAWVQQSMSGPVRQDPVDPTVLACCEDFDGDIVDDFGSYLPAGAEANRIDQTTVTVQTAAGIGLMQAVIGRSWDPALEGRYTVTSGRTPATANEAMATTSALDRLGIRVGQTAVLTRPEPMEYTIVGVIDDDKHPSATEELFFGAAPNAAGDVDALQLMNQPVWYITGAPLTWPDVQKLNAEGAVVLSRDVVLDPPVVHDGEVEAIKAGRAQGQFWTSGALLLIGIFGLLQVALLATAAFMVGARQQERTLAILGSVGAERRMLRTIVSLGGLLLGTVGAAAGVVIGVGAGWLIMQVTRDGSASQYPGFVVNPLITGAIVVLAIAFSWIAAAIPARAASRIDVVTALRGTSRPAAPRKKTPIIGIVLVILGATFACVGGVLFGVFSGSSSPVKVGATITLAALGPITVLVGVIFIAPTILRWVSGALSVVTIGSRLASRDAARNAARTVPAIAAVISSVFVAAFGTCIAASAQVSSDRYYTYSAPMGEVSLSLVDWGSSSDGPVLGAPGPRVQALSEAFDVADIQVLSSAAADLTAGDENSGGIVVAPRPAPQFVCRWDSSDPSIAAAAADSPACLNPPSILTGYSSSYETKIMIGNPSDLALVLGEKLSARSLAALEDGGAVSLYPQYVNKDTVELDWWTANGDREFGTEKPSRTKTVPAVVQRPEHDLPFGILITPETAASLQIVSAPTTIFARLATPATTAQQDRASAAISALTGDQFTQVRAESGPNDYSSAVIAALLVVSTVISLAAAVAAIGLARSDGRRDDAILSAVGAPHLLRRSFGLWQAIIIAGLGSVIGVLLGVAEFVALTIPKYIGVNGGLDPAAPVVPLLIVTIGIPAVIAAGAWLSTRRGRTSVLDRSVIA